MEYIRKVSEDTVSFQKRRVEFTIEKLKKEDEPILNGKFTKKLDLDRLFPMK
jgi:hypothetical protein